MALRDVAKPTLRHLEKEFHTFLYFLCILLHQQGHFASAADMPIWDVPLAAPLVEVLPGDDMASKKAKEGKAGEKLRAMRAKLHNALSIGWRRGTAGHQSHLPTSLQEVCIPHPPRQQVSSCRSNS